MLINGIMKTYQIEPIKKLLDKLEKYPSIILDLLTLLKKKALVAF